MGVNKVMLGEEVLLDLTEDSVTPETLAEGATAHNASGEKITGTMKAGASDAVLYTEQSLTDSQKAQARGNIGAVGTVETTEEVYTYVFTGEEELVSNPGNSNVFYYLDNVTIDFCTDIVTFMVANPENPSETASLELIFGVEPTIQQNTVLDSGVNTIGYGVDGQVVIGCVYIPTDNFTLEGGYISSYDLIFPKAGVYISNLFGFNGVYWHSFTSTVPYTKTVKKIDEALIPKAAWDDVKGKPFETMDDVVTAVMAAMKNEGALEGVMEKYHYQFVEASLKTNTQTPLNITGKGKFYYGKVDVCGKFSATAELKIIVDGEEYFSASSPSTSDKHAFMYLDFINPQHELDNHEYLFAGGYKVLGANLASDYPVDHLPIAKGTWDPPVKITCLVDGYIEFNESLVIQATNCATAIASKYDLCYALEE